jgi:hypothetical protein
VGLVANGEADIGVGEFVVNEERSEVVAFIDTIDITGYVSMFYIFYRTLKFKLFI